jgi:peptidyl-prolyl cis-trans isomerase SurA
MKRIAIFAAMIAILQFFFQGCSTQQHDQVVAEFGTTKITLSEFEKAYNKNAAQNKTPGDTAKQYDNFLDLYVKFKMKLEDANSRHYEDNADLKNELADYRKKVGITYILEKQLVDPNLHRLWEFRHKEMRLSHLMIRPDSTGDEAARKKAQALLDSIKGGKNFEELVKKYSQDNYSKPIGGDIYYFTAGTFLPEFEEAFFKTPVGQIYPELIKTRYGYHILKVTEVRDRVPEVHAAHILVDYLNEKGESDSVSARLRADSVYNMLTVEKKDFAELAKKYSKDNGSKDKGGDLGFYPRRSMIKEFDEASFNLKPGEISRPLKTQYGYHIIKLIAQKPFPSFEDDKEAIKTNYKQYRYQNDYDTLSAGLKKKYNYRIDSTLLTQVIKISDTVRMSPEVLKSQWAKQFHGKTLFTIDTRAITIDSVFGYMNTHNDFAGRPLNSGAYDEALKKLSSDIVMEVAAGHLDETNPEFASLMDDYKNGIFIFKLQEEMIWSKVVVDSAKLVAFYEKTKENYKWPDRVEFTEIFARNDSVLAICKELLAKGISFDSVAAQFTDRTGMKEKAGRFELQEFTTSDLSREAAKLQKPGDVSEPFANSGGFSIFKLVKKDLSHLKTFEEARPEVSGAFQEEESKRLEAEYLQSLDQKYKPVLHKDVLAKAFKN